jgi:hypothetical protein
MTDSYLIRPSALGGDPRCCYWPNATVVGASGSAAVVDAVAEDGVRCRNPRVCPWGEAGGGGIGSFCLIQEKGSGHAWEASL